MPRSPLQAVAGLGAVLALLLLAPGAMTAAHAEDSYRYWSYWWGSEAGEWEYAQTGPADRELTDGDVEGWRFLTSAEAVPTDLPSAPADFAAICTDGEPIPGQVRVGMVIDYGSPADVPDGDAPPEGDNPRIECVTVPQGSTAEQALAAVADVRTESGAVCGIDGYPAAGCFEIVAVPATGDAAVQGEADATAAEDESSGVPVWPIAAGAAVLAAVAVLLIARRKGAAAE